MEVLQGKYERNAGDVRQLPILLLELGVEGAPKFDGMSVALIFLRVDIAFGKRRCALRWVGGYRFDGRSDAIKVEHKIRLGMGPVDRSAAVSKDMCLRVIR